MRDVGSSMINIATEPVWVEFHFRPQQGIKNLTGAQRIRINSVPSN
jgi:catalase